MNSTSSRLVFLASVSFLGLAACGKQADPAPSSPQTTT
ncbi:MAG: hypothetical protein JWP97_1963, partial [Labilithrix sp.]|nr:hypothetical protein [Labilithrix sp.]